MLLAIDPGLVSGWALFNDVGRLQNCGVFDFKGRTERVEVTPLLPRSLTHARVIIERPRIYPGGRTKNPNDVLAVAVNAGEWAGRYRELGFEVEYVEPSQWKGQVPKDVHHPRILATLSEKELELVPGEGRGPGKLAKSKRHNVLDAIGIGLWALRKVRGPK